MKKFSFICIAASGSAKANSDLNAAIAAEVATQRRANYYLAGATVVPSTASVQGNHLITLVATLEFRPRTPPAAPAPAPAKEGAP